MHKNLLNNNSKKIPPIEHLIDKLILTGSDIVTIGQEAELLVGGKNYNTAILSQIHDIKIPQFRAISSKAFHQILDESKVCAAVIRETVETEYASIDWSEPSVTEDYEFLQKFVRRVAITIHETLQKKSQPPLIRLRTFIEHVVEGFSSSQEDIDRLRKRSILVQVAILSVSLPLKVKEAIQQAYHDICKEAEEENIPVAVRSSAAGEDSHKKAFAGLQDTYLNMVGEDAVIQAYHWNCASAYNLRSMIYRRESIIDALLKSEQTGNESYSLQAKKEWGIENTSLSVCIMRMVNPVVSGTAFSADTATGFRGTDHNDLVSIDVSYGLGEAVVGGMVTPDKLYVYQKNDGNEIVLRFMGNKAVKIIYNEHGGTKKILVPEQDAITWAISITQAEQVAKGVRVISKTYDNIIMDTEFCIDAKGNIWFVQARPETRWNEELAHAPHTIFMRRSEVEPNAAAAAEIILEGNGASCGAGKGKVCFLRSALELNKIQKGDILAADRTDPDMVPGMRVASAILANVGGDTSHAAITSRELGIPAVIGIQNSSAIKALDGLNITVDGTRGRIYKGLLPLYEAGGEINVANIPKTKTKVGLVLADINQALFLSRLRNIPDFEVGLLRAEFMLGNIGAHPAALEAFDDGTLETIIQEKIQEVEQRFRITMQEQIQSGLIDIDLELYEHVGYISGYLEEIGHLNKKNIHCSSKEQKENNTQIKELEKKLSLLVEQCSHALPTLKVSTNLTEHVKIIMGYEKQLCHLQDSTPQSKKQREKFEKEITIFAADAAQNPVIQKTLHQIEETRKSIGKKFGFTQEIKNLQSISTNIGALIRNCGHKTGREHYIQTLSQGLALFSIAFYGKPIIYRTTDFKTNEYRNLLGGVLFENFEDNPMLGYRGVARDIHDWEIEAFKIARSTLGATNLQLMLPFVRTIEQARSMRLYLENVHKIESGKDNLKIILMSELPSNAILARQFIQEFDGFSIGSNDMTQMVLATDRDNYALSHIYDEEDPAVIWAILVTIFTGQKYRKKVGFCGQGVANSPILRGIVAISGITSASVVPDTYQQTKEDIASIEALNIPITQLGCWISQQHKKNLYTLLEQNNYKNLKTSATNEEIKTWYDTEIKNIYTQLQKKLPVNQKETLIAELKKFRSCFHKTVIYATWPWDETIQDALHQSGFSNFEEQQEHVLKNNN